MTHIIPKMKPTLFFKDERLIRTFNYSISIFHTSVSEVPILLSKKSGYVFSRLTYTFYFILNYSFESILESESLMPFVPPDVLIPRPVIKSHNSFRQHLYPDKRSSIKEIFLSSFF